MKIIGAIILAAWLLLLVLAEYAKHQDSDAMVLARVIARRVRRLQFNVPPSASAASSHTIGKAK